MKNKIITIILTTALLLFSRLGLTESAGSIYFGIQYAVTDYTDDDYSRSFNPELLMARFGGYIIPNVSIEARLGFGVQDDTQFQPEYGVSGLDVSMELESIMGLYATGRVDLTESASVYGVLGVSCVEATAKAPEFPIATSTNCETGPSYGAGFNVDFAEKISLNIEYMKYLDKSDIGLSAVGIGVVFNY